MSYFRNVALIFPMWQRRRDSQTPPRSGCQVSFRHLLQTCIIEMQVEVLVYLHASGSSQELRLGDRIKNKRVFSCIVLFFLLHSWRSGRILRCDCTAKQPPPTWILKRSLNGSNALRCPLVTTLLLLPPPAAVFASLHIAVCSRCVGGGGRGREEGGIRRSKHHLQVETKHTRGSTRCSSEAPEL